MKVIFTPKAKKVFLKLDKTIQQQIKKFILKLEAMRDPRTSGKMLVGNLFGFWRYRVGDYRVLCKIKNNELVITVIDVGHRRDVYDK